MASVSNVLDDIKEASALIAARGSVDGDGKSTIALQKNLVTSIATTISRLAALSPGDAKLILQAIESKHSGLEHGTVGRMSKLVP